MGWSIPSSRRRFSFTLASADSDIMTSMGSPGVRWMSVKTPAVTSSSTGTVARRRRRTRRPTGRGGGRAYFSQTVRKRIMPSGIGS